jgi:hypothetical protein
MIRPLLLRCSLAGLTTLLIACQAEPVATPIPMNEVPRERILATPPAPADTTQGATLTVSRKENYVGSGQAVVISLDGVALAELRTAEQVHFTVAAGTHVLGATAKPGGDPRTLNIALEPGSQHRYGANMELYGLYLVEETDAAR